MLHNHLQFKNQTTVFLLTKFLCGYAYRLRQFQSDKSRPGICEICYKLSVPTAGNLLPKVYPWAGYFFKVLNNKELSDISKGRYLLIPKYFLTFYDYVRKADLSKGYWNPKRKLGVATHLSCDQRKLSNNFSKKRQVWDFFLN